MEAEAAAIEDADTEAIALGLAEGSPTTALRLEAIEEALGMTTIDDEVAVAVMDSAILSVGAAKIAPLTESSVSVRGSFMFDTGPPGKVYTVPGLKN